MKNGDATLKLEAHDASRIEWSVYLPLPADGECEHDAEVELSLQVPENAYTAHTGWDQLQLLARLSSPSDEGLGRGTAPISVDELRRATLAAARRLKLLRESLSRACVAHGLTPVPTAPRLARELEGIIDQAAQTLSQARASLVVAVPGDPAALRRERELADEFLSGQLLELLTVAEGLCAKELAAPPAAEARQPGYRAVGQRLRRRISAALLAELEHRAERGQILPSADDPDLLGAYLERAARLKKHFHEVLFLEPESQMVDQQWRNLVGVGGAASAFLGYFALNALQSSAATSAGLGLGTVLTLGALAYAAKDRMKELSKAWLAGKLSHLYAHRVLKLRAPARLCASRPVVLSGREGFSQQKVAIPDPLNPDAGSVQRVVELRYRLRGKVRPLTGAARGFERMKLVFRYDLSPLLSRLDDSVKRVPVPGLRRGVRFADAPRLYRMPLSLSLRAGGQELCRAATVLLQRGGIDRIVETRPAHPEEDLAGALPAAR